MNIIKTVLAGFIVVASSIFRVSAAPPSAPPDGLRDLGADAEIRYGSASSKEFNVGSDSLLKEGPRFKEGRSKESLVDSFAFVTDKKNPWFIVTMKSVSEIKTIYIQNRVVWCRANIEGLTVSVSDDNKTWKEVWKADHIKPEYTINLNPGEKAQYIKFEIPPNRDCLNLNNVRIYGK